MQKATASTMQTLALALKMIMKSSSAVEVIGTRHGEKQYETLLTREEMARAEDCGDYYRVVADNRDLNYGLYFSEGSTVMSHLEDYNSHNTRRLSVDEMIEMLLKLECVQVALAGGQPE